MTSRPGRSINSRSTAKALRVGLRQASPRQTHSFARSRRRVAPADFFAVATVWSKKSQRSVRISPFLAPYTAPRRRQPNGGDAENVNQRQSEEAGLLTPDRAFVVQFRAGSDRRPARWDGRVEHVVSGEATAFRSLEELRLFVGRVLGNLAQTVDGEKFTKGGT